MHFYCLWCHLFHVLSLTKSMNVFQICPSKNVHWHQQPFGSSIPCHPLNQEPANSVHHRITTKTVAYIFSLVIGSVTLLVHHSDVPHSHALQHEAAILQELDSMPPDDLQAELRAALISFYTGILKVPGPGPGCLLISYSPDHQSPLRWGNIHD